MNYKKLLKLLGQISIYLLAGLFIYKKLDGDITSIFEYDIYSYPLLLLSILIYIPLTLFNGLNWFRMMILSGYDSLNRLDQVEVYLKSFFLRYIPGNVVGILSRATLNKKYNVSMIHSLWAWFFENIVYLFLGLTLGTYIVIKNLTELSGIFSSWAGKEVAFLSLGIFLILIAIILAAISILRLDLLEKVFNRFLLPKIEKGRKSSYKGFAISTKGRVEMTLRYLISWAIPSLSFLVLVFAITGVVPAKPFELLSAQALAWAIGYIVIVTPSGGGVRELVLIFLLSSILGFSPEASVIITLASRVVSIVAELLALGIFYPYYYNEKRVH